MHDTRGHTRSVRKLKVLNWCSFIYRSIYLAVVQRRDISLFYIQRHLPRRCSSARFQSLIYRDIYLAVVQLRDFSLLYTEAFTSPLYNGEISVSFIYRGIHFAYSGEISFCNILACEQAPKWGIGRRQKSSSDTAIYAPLGSLFTG